MRKHWYKVLAALLCILMLLAAAPTAMQTSAEEAEQQTGSEQTIGELPDPEEAFDREEEYDPEEAFDWDEEYDLEGSYDLEKQLAEEQRQAKEKSRRKALAEKGLKGKETHSDEPLSLGENTFAITEPYEEVYRPFTPEEDGFYSFYSVSEYDTIGYLYASSDMESAIADDDDSGTELNFSFHAYLTAGETYYLRVYMYDKKENGTYTVIIRQLPENSCGDNLTWTFDETAGLLKIEGTGEMWYMSEIPWESLQEQIRSISLPDGLEKISDYAFANCSSVGSVSIPANVKYIKEGAFYGCSSLRSVAIPNGITSVAEYCFYGCSALETVTLPISVHYIYSHAFDGCTALSTVCYRGTEEQKDQQLAYVATGNTVLMSADWQYLNEACPHINSWESNTYGDHTYTDLGDDIWHQHDFTVTPYSYCGDCGQRFNYGTPEHRSEIERHWYDKDDGVCSDCGHVNHCRHLRRVTGYWWEDCTVEDTGSNSEHRISGTYMYYEYCLDCGIELLYELREGQMTEPHDYDDKDDDDTCYRCGHFNTCTHPNGTATRWGWTKDECGDFDETYHSIFGEIYIETYCPVCGKVFDYDFDSRYEKAEHDYDEHGYCRICGHKNNGTALEGVIEWNAEDVQFKGTTPYVIANGSEQTPRFTVKNKADGSVIDPAYYSCFYTQNVDAGTGYVLVSFRNGYKGNCRGNFKIYLPATTTTTVANVKDGIKLTWSKVEGADGYVVYRRAWSSTTNGWTGFVRWNNTTALNWIDAKVYAGTRYQYGIKAYFNKRTDPVNDAQIGGNVGDNYNLGEVGPLKTTVRITTRTLNSVTAGTKQMTVKWGTSSVFTGYQIQYATNSAFTQNAKTVKITNPKTASTVIKSLTSGKTYYVRIRSYHEFNGMTYFGGWSNVLNCKVK